VPTASSGLTLLAARAGIQLATSATNASAAAQTANTIGSVVLTPKIDHVVALLLLTT
jgi:hypothetical protein